MTSPTPNPLQQNINSETQSNSLQIDQPIINLLPSPTPKPKSEKAKELKRYLLKYRDVKNKEKVKDKILEQGGKIRKEFKNVNAISTELTDNDVAELKNDENIEIIEQDFNVKTNSETIPWGIEDIKAPVAYNIGVKGSGIKVAVFDTGISPHEDLSISGGISFVDSTQSYYDDNGHGTHVSGIISALYNNMGIVGVAPDISLYSVKVIKADGSGSYSSIIDGIEWAIDNKINIINMSFGGNEYSQILEEAINKAYENNILIFASVGNEGGNSTTDSILYPARYDNVVSVGAVDQNNSRASFSSTGAELEIMAPGVDISSTLYDGSYGLKVEHQWHRLTLRVLQLYYGVKILL